MRLYHSPNSRCHVEMTFEDCGDDVNLLRLSPWLEEALDEHTAAAGKDSIACVSSFVVYDNFDLRPVINKIQTQGRCMMKLTPWNKLRPCPWIFLTTT